MSNKRLSIIAIVGKECFDRIDKIKKDLCKLSNSKAALQFPPHITLIHLKIPEEDLTTYVKKIKNLLKEFKPFKIQTDNIIATTYEDKGKTEYTIRFKIKENQKLEQLNKLLSKFQGEKKKQEYRFHPHLTLVFGDLTKENYNKLKKYIEKNKKRYNKNFEFSCKEIWVLSKQKNIWKPTIYKLTN